RQPGDLLPIEFDAALTRRHCARQGLERGGLPGAVAPQERHDAALRHLDRHPLQDVALVVETMQISCNQTHAAPPVIMLPRYAERTRSSLRMTSGVPSTSTCPSCITVMVSEISITIPMLCSISTTVWSTRSP